MGIAITRSSHQHSHHDRYISQGQDPPFGYYIDYQLARTHEFFHTPGRYYHPCQSWSRCFKSAANYCLRSSIADMSRSQLSVTAAQDRGTKTSEEEVFFDRFVKAKVSKSLYKSKKPCLVSNEPSLELSFSAKSSATPLSMPGKSPLHTVHPGHMNTNPMVTYACMQPVGSHLISSSGGTFTGMKRSCLKP